MAVVAARKLDDPVARRGRAGDAYRAHRRLGSGIDEPDSLDRRDEAADQPAELDFLRRRRAEAGAAAGRGSQCARQPGRRMSVNERTPRHDVVDVRAAVDVPDARAARPLDERRLAPDGAERAHRTVDAAGKHAFCACEQLAGFRMCGAGHTRKGTITRPAGRGRRRALPGAIQTCRASGRIRRRRPWSGRQTSRAANS